jgi:catechol 2,3-dioxygenase-like lactoylglutathione lyase family enzyme
MNKPAVKSIIAQLPCLDFEESKRFYIKILICRLVEEFNYLLIFLMDNLEFHLWKCDDKTIPENSSIYRHVNEIDKLFWYYKKRLFGKIQISDRPWGMREFYIVDPSSNLLKFGQKIQE